MESIKVISASDSNYARHLGAMMVSLLENTSSKENIEFLIIDGDISVEDKERLYECSEKYGCKITFLKLNPDRYKNLTVKSYVSQVTYFRIFLPEILDSSIKKGIYLDCDLIVKGDIAKLWEIDVSQYFLAAVEDIGMENTGDFGAVVKRHIGMPRRIKYFNAGVLIINIDKWRTANISDKLRDYLLVNKEKITFADQDGLNAVFMEQWLSLPMEWNLQSCIFELLNKNRITRKDMMDAVLNPMIIHYTEKSKPWYPTDIHPLKSEYIKYACLTPWRDMVDSNIKGILIRILKKTFAGKALSYYQLRINDYYIIDKMFIPDKLSSSHVFRLIYSLFFPFIFTYLRIFSKIVAYLYFIENKKLNGNESSMLYRILYLAIFPVRYLIPKKLGESCKKDVLSTKYTCPCCGYKTFTKETIGAHEPCRNCCWEYDPVQHETPDYAGGANEVSLTKAQQNYVRYGVSEERYRYKYYFNQTPFYSCKKDMNWKMIMKEDDNEIGIEWRKR